MKWMNKEAGWVWGLVVAVWSCYQVSVMIEHIVNNNGNESHSCWSNHYGVTAGFTAPAPIHHLPCAIPILQLRTLMTLTTWKADQLFYCLSRWRGDCDWSGTRWGHACSPNHNRCIQLPICHRTPLCTPPLPSLWLPSQTMPYTWLMSVIFVHFGYCQFHHAALASHCRCDMQQNDANPVDLHTLGPSILFPSSVLKWPSKSRNEQIWIYDSPIC